MGSACSGVSSSTVTDMTGHQHDQTNNANTNNATTQQQRQQRRHQNSTDTDTGGGGGCCSCFFGNDTHTVAPDRFRIDYTSRLESDLGTRVVQQQQGGGRGRRHINGTSATIVRPVEKPSSSVFDMLYGRYLPFVVRERFLTAHAQGHSLKPQCELECFEAALSFIDISGFTRLSGELVNQHGTNGAEILNEIISGYFKKLIDVIVEFGGDVLKFAGDAMLVMWRNKTRQATITLDASPTASFTAAHNNDPPSPSTRKNVNAFMGTSEGEPLSTLLLRAIACNLTLLKLHNNFQPTPTNILQLHMGLAAGTVSGIYTGGTDGCWEFFIAGDPIHQMSVACDAAKSGEVVIHGSSSHLVENCCQLKKCTNDVDAYAITRLTDAPKMFKCSAPPIPSSPALTETLEAFIPRIIKGRMERDWASPEGPDGMMMPLADATQTSLWLAEFRQRVTVMFVALPPLEYRPTAEGNAATLAVLQELVVAVQESVSKWEGSVARLLADDKGTRFKIAFGMPSLTHEDDAIRAVSAAMEIESRIRRITTTHPLASQALKQGPAGFVTECSIGIASGTVYCGEAGSSVRCEYTAVGFIVILAARLMSASVHSGGGILIDRASVTAVENTESHTITFEARPALQLKGVPEPTVVYRPHTSGALSTKGAKLLGLADEATRVSGKGKKQQALQALQQHIHVNKPKFLPIPTHGASSQYQTSAAGSSSSSSSAPNTGRPSAHTLGGGGNPGSGGATPRKHSTIQRVRRSIINSRGHLHGASTSNITLLTGEESSSPYTSSLIGRSREKAFFLSLLNRVAHSAESHVVLIESEAGLGKSALIYDTLESVERMGIEFYYGSGDMIEKRSHSTACFAWRSVFEQLFPGLESLTHPSQRRKHMEDNISEDLLGYAVLLNTILNTNFRETDLTLHMTPESRMKRLQFLLVSILRETARKVHSAILPSGLSGGGVAGLRRGSRPRSISEVDHAALTSSVASPDDDVHDFHHRGTSSIHTPSSGGSSSSPRYYPRVIVLEDLHFFDVGSWELLVDVCRELPNLLILLTTRPLLAKVPQLTRLERMRGPVDNIDGEETKTNGEELKEAYFHKVELNELDRNEAFTLAWILFGGTIPRMDRASVDSRSFGDDDGNSSPVASHRHLLRTHDSAGVGTSAYLPTATGYESVPVLLTSTVSSQLPSSVQMPQALQTLLYEASRGSPLYLEELCRSLIDEGVVVPHPATKTTPFSISYKPSGETTEAMVGLQRGGSLTQGGHSTGGSVSIGSVGLTLPHGTITPRPSSSSSSSHNNNSSVPPSLSSMSFTKNVLQLMMSRIDRLPSSEQMTLKVCSVIGIEVRLDIVIRIHPMQSNKNTSISNSVLTLTTPGSSIATDLLRRDMSALVAAGILLSETPLTITLPTSSGVNDVITLTDMDGASIQQEGLMMHNMLPSSSLPTSSSASSSPPPGLNGVTIPLYSFKNAMFREAAYSMLSMQQRVTLHEQCAHFYEKLYGITKTSAQQHQQQHQHHQHHHTIPSDSSSGSISHPTPLPSPSLVSSSGSLGASSSTYALPQPSPSSSTAPASSASASSSAAPCTHCTSPPIAGGVVSPLPISNDQFVPADVYSILAFHYAKAEKWHKALHS